jgi:hypothetical protein
VVPAPPEVAEVFRRYGEPYRQQRGASLSTAQRRAMTAIELCRTAVCGAPHTAEFEREIIVERVRAGLAKARAKGKRLGRPVRDPAAAARIIALKDEGLSLRQIAARERLSPSGVRKVLQRAEAAIVPS